MSLKHSRILIAALCGGCVTAVVIWHLLAPAAGRKECRISSLVKPVTMSVRAPLLPFRSGEMSILVDGTLKERLN